ncbi:unnamed protein product [Clonostachys rhizophaga]|uniref:Proline racemase n=1 Tax=Clonostachys rhizophaga TaxID=160324 RepID=A0A9N9V9M4_9HYPO|nr:unnamed protein product [Clonostachys rhizophaga]
MESSRYISVVSCHAEGEAGDVIVGGVRDVPAKTMKEKFLYFRKHREDLRLVLLNEPRGRPEMSVVLILPPGDWSPMSGSNAICTATVMLETEPWTEVLFDTAAGLVKVIARCEQGECKSVSLQNIPAFVYGLDLPIDVPGIASNLGLQVSNECGTQLMELGKRVKAAVLEKHNPIHPESPEFCGIDNIAITEPLQDLNREKTAKQAMTGAHVGQAALLGWLFFMLRDYSIRERQYNSRIRELTKVGDKDTVLPTIERRGWITSYK